MDSTGVSHARAGRGGGVTIRAYRFAQCVVVKTRVQRVTGKNPGAAIRKRLNYIEREGVAKDGGQGQIFGQEDTLDKEGVEAFAERGESCRHQFRFIVSPEQGNELDLEAYTRALVKQMT